MTTENGTLFTCQILALQLRLLSHSWLSPTMFLRNFYYLKCSTSCMTETSLSYTDNQSLKCQSLRKPAALSYSVSLQGSGYLLWWLPLVFHNNVGSPISIPSCVAWPAILRLTTSILNGLGPATRKQLATPWYKHQWVGTGTNGQKLISMKHYVCKLTATSKL